MPKHGIYIYYYDENGKRVVEPLSPQTEPVSEWDEYMLFTIEPALATIAINAATTRYFSMDTRARIFSSSMKLADKFVGESARDPRLRSQDAWDFFSDYMFDLLGL